MSDMFFDLGLPDNSPPFPFILTSTKQHPKPRKIAHPTFQLTRQQQK